MKLNVNDIEEQPRSFAFHEPTDALNADLVHGTVTDFEFRDGAEVTMSCERNGDDFVLLGRIEGSVVGHCSRCLETYPFEVSSEFSVVCVPREHAPPSDDEDVDESSIHYYDSDEIDLSPLVRENLILALPTKPLCEENCKGLCPQCGTNLNLETCECRQDGGDPRLAVLRNLKLKH